MFWSTRSCKLFLFHSLLLYPNYFMNFMNFLKLLPFFTFSSGFIHHSKPHDSDGPTMVSNIPALSKRKRKLFLYFPHSLTPPVPMLHLHLSTRRNTRSQILELLPFSQTLSIHSYLSISFTPTATFETSSCSIKSQIHGTTSSAKFKKFVVTRILRPPFC